MAHRYEFDDDEFAEGGADDGTANATIACPNCRRMIYDDAERCPHCDDYIIEAVERGRAYRWWIVAAWVLAFMALAAFLMQTLR